MLYSTRILKGEVSLSGDKSISHRVILLASIINGRSKIKNLSISEDITATLNVLLQCGIKSNLSSNELEIFGGTFKEPSNILNCQGSGTTARLISGLLIGLNINFNLNGNMSLQKRPMGRLLDHFRSVGANLNYNNILPIVNNGSNLLSSGNFKITDPSSQIKTSLIFYSLVQSGKSIIKYNFKTRDHLEILLKYLKYPITIKNNIIVINGPIRRNKGLEIVVPGDVSSASFIIASALLLKGSNITLKKILINKYRMGFIKILIKMGGKIKIINQKKYFGENIADINVKYTNNLSGIHIDKETVISMIDEIPIFSIVASLANSDSIIEDINELRYKESNRIDSILHNLNNMGGSITEKNNCLYIKGKRRLYNTIIKPFNDHRIAMSFYIATHFTDSFKKNDIDSCYHKSFPDFLEVMGKLYHE